MDSTETRQKETHAKLPENALLMAVLGLFFAYAAYTAAKPHGLWPDEALYFGATVNFFSGKGLSLGVDGGVFPALPLLSGILSLFTGGLTKYAFYLATILAGVACGVFTFLLGKKILKSPEYSLLATALVLSNTVFLFYSTRILLDVYDAAVGAAGLYLLLEWMEKPSSGKKSLALASSLAISYFVRVPDFVSLLSATAAAVAILWLQKRLPGPRPLLLLLGATAAPILAWMFVFKVSFLGFYTQQNLGSSLPVAMQNLPNFFQSALFFMGGPLQAAGFLAGLGVFLFSGRKESVIFLAFLMTAAAARLPAFPYDARYLLSVLPIGCIFLIYLFERTLSTTNLQKNFLLAGISAAVLFLMIFPSFTRAESMFAEKAGGYLEIEYSGDWLAKNTPPDEQIFAGAHRIVGLFSKRQVHPLPATEEELLANLSRGEIRYIEINNYDWGQPKYALSLPSKYPGNFSLAKQFVNQQTGGGSAILVFTH